MDLSICNNMDGARKLMLSEMSDREREIQYYVTYMQNFENKNPPKFIDTENRLVITRGRGAWWAKMGEDGQNIHISETNVMWI